MGKTAHFEWPWPLEGAEADPPLDLEKLAKAIEAVVHLLPVSELRSAGAGDANKLLVVQGTGTPAWQLMKGDATFAADGTLSIGGEKVTEAMVKALAISAGKLAVGSVITTKLAEEAVTGLKVAKLAIETKHLANGAVTREKLASEARPFHWYPPKIILNEEGKEGAGFGTLPQADEVKGVDLPNGGLIQVLYDATWRGDEGEGVINAAIFLDGVQLKAPDGGAGEPFPEEATKALNGFPSGYFARVSSYWNGLISNDSVGDATGNVDYGSGVAMGHLQGTRQSAGGPCYIYADPGNYDISVRFRTSAGKVRATRRKLYVGVLGNGS